MVKPAHLKSFRARFTIMIITIPSLPITHIFHGKIIILRVEHQWNTVFEVLTHEMLEVMTLIFIPGGCVRVDRSRLAFEYELTLGHYGLPHIDGKKAEIHQFEDGTKKIITASLPGRRLAL